MNLIYGDVVERLPGQGFDVARVRVGGAIYEVVLDLVTDAEPGDRVLLCDGVAIAKVEEVTADERSNPENSW
jgi:hydrogenase maturation factor